MKLRATGNLSLVYRSEGGFRMLCKVQHNVRLDWQLNAFKKKRSS